MGACGGDGESRDPARCHLDGGEHCFQVPTAVMVSHFEDQDLDTVIGCGPLEPALAATNVTLSGTITDYSGGGEVADATITIYDDEDFTNEIGNATTAADGTYSIGLPAGTPDILFGTLEADGYVTLHDYNGRPDLTGATAELNLVMATEELLDTFAGLVDTDLDPDGAIVAAIASDCDRNSIEHVAAVVSATSGERDFVDGVNLFYTAAGALPVPVTPDVRGDSNDNGLIAILNVPAQPVYLQLWGFPDEAALARGEDGLELVAEYAIDLDAGTSNGFVAFANQ